MGKILGGRTTASAFMFQAFFVGISLFYNINAPAIENRRKQSAAAFDRRRQNQTFLRPTASNPVEESIMSNGPPPGPIQTGTQDAQVQHEARNQEYAA